MSALIRRTALIPRLKSWYSDLYLTCHHHSRSTGQRNRPPTGVYGFEHLKTPRGFQRFVDDAIERSTEFVNLISKMPSSAEVVRAMDEISDTVCCVLDSAELCRRTHPDREFVKEANKASLRINEYLHVRKTAHIKGNSVPDANHEVFDKLIAARHELSRAKGGVFFKGKAPFITFVLGGPGSGKGTQCEKIVENFGLKHLSAGDLLRREIASNSAYGTMILDTIKEGKIVPSEVTVKLIQKEMESSDNYKFLIDGFPRSEENRTAFERITGAEPNIVLFFDCPEEEMVKRVLNRNQGRVDDNIDTIRKRLKVFEALNLPVVNYYSKKGKLYTINAMGTVDEIFEQVRPVFTAHEELIR